MASSLLTEISNHSVSNTTRHCVCAQTIEYTVSSVAKCIGNHWRVVAFQCWFLFLVIAISDRMASRFLVDTMDAGRQRTTSFADQTQVFEHVHWTCAVLWVFHVVCIIVAVPRWMIAVQSHSSWIKVRFHCYSHELVLLTYLGRPREHARLIPQLWPVKPSHTLPMAERFVSHLSDVYNTEAIFFCLPWFFCAVAVWRQCAVIRMCVMITMCVFLISVTVLCVFNSPLRADHYRGCQLGWRKLFHARDQLCRHENHWQWLFRCCICRYAFVYEWESCH